MSEEPRVGRVDIPSPGRQALLRPPWAWTTLTSDSCWEIQGERRSNLHTDLLRVPILWALTVHTHLSLCAGMCACGGMCMCVQVFVCVCACTCVCIYVGDVCAHVGVYTYICICICRCVHAPVCASMWQRPCMAGRADALDFSPRWHWTFLPICEKCVWTGTWKAKGTWPRDPAKLQGTTPPGPPGPPPSVWMPHRHLPGLCGLNPGLWPHQKHLA